MYEDDYSWLPSLEEEIKFVPGKKYLIKDGNNWNVLIFVKYDPEYLLSGFRDIKGTYEAYIFKSVDGYDTSTFGRSHLEKLATKGYIKPYDADFNWFSELNVKKASLDSKSRPILNGNFVILFQNGVEPEKTYDLQEKLFQLGFKWYGKKSGAIITSKDIGAKIFTIECLNWDTSLYTYSQMDSQQRDKKLLLMSRYIGLEDEREQERKLSYIFDHDVEVIDGYDLISKI